MPKLLLFKRNTRKTSTTEAERLIAVWGPGAYDVARNLSFRESAGFLETASPGFWGSVAREVGHRIGVPEAGHLDRDLLAF
jgi:hypothetical protein